MAETRQAVRDQIFKAVVDAAEALETTAGNIRSLGPVKAIPSPYEVWLTVVEDAALQCREAIAEACAYEAEIDADLYAALEAMADDYERLCGDGITESNQPPQLAAARAALAKARGEG